MSALLGLLAAVPLRAWLLAGSIVLGLAAVGYATHAVYERGRAAAVTNIEEANHASEQKADQAVDPVDRCYAGGGRWDRFERVCVGAGH